MHPSAEKNASIFVKKYITIDAPIVLDVGSFDVNGTLKSVLPENSKYTGIDIEYGKNVDCIISKDYKFPLEDNSFDIIVSSSCFEHCDFFWLVFLEMVRCLKKNGYIYINAPSTGHYHGYPSDYYRFYQDSGKALVKWANYNNYNCVLTNSYIDWEDSPLWNDNVMIIQKL